MHSLPCWDRLTDSLQTTYASLPARVICCQNAAHTVCQSVSVVGHCNALGVVWKKNSQWILDCTHKRANKGEEARGSKIVKVTIDTPVLSRLVRIALACQNEAKLLKSRFI